jgi:hypothetical protein
MDENQVVVDLDRLRTVANRVERSADALRRFRFAGLDADELRGSEVGPLTRPALVAARLDELIDAISAWAGAARAVGGRIDEADENTADRLGGR